jgi:t-SNARE complex subunit (syntaxin)
LTQSARQALDDATNRHNEILKLERSISELNDLFVDIYELVALQVIFH